MSDKGEIATVPCVKFVRLLPGPIEKVWSLIAETGNLPAWFGDNSTIEPRQGGHVSLMDGHIRGVVTQWQPPHKLIYTWNVFSPGETVTALPESYPTFELEAHGNKVQLTLTHFPVLERFEKQNAMGWHTFLDIVSATARRESVAERPVYMKKNAALYEVDLANLQR